MKNLLNKEVEVGFADNKCVGILREKMSPSYQ
jgi:hypothetical protein